MRNRKKKNGERRLENLSSLILREEEIAGLNESAPFDSKRPLRLEIGCGKGDFVTGMAGLYPDFNYIAVERVSDVALLAVEKYAKSRHLGYLGDHGEWITPDGVALKGDTWRIPLEDAGNVRFFIGPAELFLDLAAGGSFESIYMNFSDPWSKKGYASRRLTHPNYLVKYAKLLTAGGKIHLKTDNDGLFDYTFDTLAENGWTVDFSTRNLHSPDSPEEIRNANVMTEYEKKFTELGVPIKYLSAHPN